MPLLSLCSYPGCRHPVPRGEKYCDKHKGAGTRREQLQKKERWERRFRKKGSSAAEAMALVGGDFASAFFQNTLFARSV